MTNEQAVAAGEATAGNGIATVTAAAGESASAISRRCSQGKHSSGTAPLTLEFFVQPWV